MTDFSMELSNQEKKPLTRSPLMPRNPLVPLEKQKNKSIIQILTPGEHNFNGIWLHAAGGREQLLLNVITTHLLLI